MYMNCEICRRPITKGGAYQEQACGTIFRMCETCNLYFNMLMNRKTPDITANGMLWAQFIMDYELIEPLKKASLSEIFMDANKFVCEK